MATLQPVNYAAPAPNLPSDPHPCEICGASVPLAQLHSIAIVYRMPGSLGSAMYPAYQCPAEQHFACSHDHAAQAAQACLTEHIAYGPHGA